MSRELGETIATATATMIPDWRLLRTEHPGWIRKLVAAQPESHVREAQQYGPLLRMISDHLPGHIRAMVPDLEAIIELRTLAREASAFLIGCEVGRCQAQRHVDDRAGACGSGGLPTVSATSPEGSGSTWTRARHNGAHLAVSVVQSRDESPRDAAPHSRGFRRMSGSWKP